MKRNIILLSLLSILSIILPKVSLAAGTVDLQTGKAFLMERTAKDEVNLYHCQNLEKIDQSELQSVSKILKNHSDHCRKINQTPITAENLLKTGERLKSDNDQQFAFISKPETKEYLLKSIELQLADNPKTHPIASNQYMLNINPGISLPFNFAKGMPIYEDKNRAKNPNFPTAPTSVEARLNLTLAGYTALMQSSQDALTKNPKQSFNILMQQASEDATTFRHINEGEILYNDILFNEDLRFRKPNIENTLAEYKVKLTACQEKLEHHNTVWREEINKRKSILLDPNIKSKMSIAEITANLHRINNQTETIQKQFTTLEKCNLVLNQRMQILRLLASEKSTVSKRNPSAAATKKPATITDEKAEAITAAMRSTYERVRVEKPVSNNKQAK